MFTNRKVLVAYIAVCIVWGSSYLATKLCIHAVSVEIAGAVRYLGASLILWMVLKIRHERYSITWHELLPMIYCGLVLRIGSTYFLMLGQTKVESGTASILVATVPLFMILIECVMKGKACVSFQSMVGLMTGFIGVIILVAQGVQYSKGESDLLPYYSLLLLSSFVWAYGGLASKRIQTNASLIYITFVQNLTGAVCYTLMIIVKKQEVIAADIVANIYPLSFLIFTTVVGFLAFAVIMQEMPAAKAGTYAYVNPIVAVLLGSIFLNEKLTGSKLIAMAIILLGVYLVQSESSNRGSKEKKWKKKRVSIGSKLSL